MIFLIPEIKSTYFAENGAVRFGLATFFLVNVYNQDAFPTVHKHMVHGHNNCTRL